MNAALFDRRRAERFAQLLDEAGGARRHHVRSRLDDELAPLVAVGHRAARLAPQVEMDTDFRAGLRAMLVATAEREGIGITATDPTPSVPAAVPVRPRVSGLPGRRARARAAVIVGIAAGTLALSGMSAASGDAMPGDPLYGIKRSTERAQLALAGSDLSRGQLYLEFAKTRVAEARVVRGGIGEVLNDMDDETRQGVRLLTGAAADRRDPAALDVVDRFVEGQRRSVAALLDGVGARERVLDSLTLLDAVTRRSAALRTSLTCGGNVSGSDVLGPVPSTCGVQETGTGTGGGRVPAGVPAPQRTEAQPSGGQPAPSAVLPSVLPSLPTPTDGGTPPVEDGDDGLLSDLGRILGGLLGG